MNKIIFLLVLTLLGACTLPQTTVRTGSQQPSLVIKGAPEGSIVYIDNLNMGDARQYDGKPKVLAILEGAHKVEVKQGTSSLHSERVFVSNGEVHTITVSGGASK